MVTAVYLRAPERESTYCVKRKHVREFVEHLSLGIQFCELFCIFIFMHRSVPLCTLQFFGPQMALAYRLDAISQGPKNSRIPENFGPEVQGSNLPSRMGSYL